MTTVPMSMIDEGMGQETGLKIAEQLKMIVRDVPLFLENTQAVIMRTSPTTQIDWYIGLVIQMLFLLGGAWVVTYGIRRLICARYVTPLAATLEHAHQKVFFLWLDGTVRLLQVGVMAGLAWGGALLEHKGDFRALDTQLMVILAISTYLGVRAFFGSFFSVYAPQARIMDLSHQDARKVWRDISRVYGIGAFIAAVCIWFARMGLDEATHLLILVGGSFITTSLLCLLVWKGRTIVHQTCEMPSAGPIKRFIMQNWSVMTILYIMVAWSISAVRMLSDMPFGFGLVLFPLMAIFAALSGWALCKAIIDFVLWHRLGSAMQSRKMTQVLHHVLAVLVLMGLAWTFLLIWGVDVTSDHSVVIGFGDVILVALTGYFIYQAVKVIIDEKIEAEGGADFSPEPGDEGGGENAASRLATLLPLFRNFILALIVAISAMIMLSQSGVDIAPLFAGAGVIGIAVGFGAQTLIRDIFSGAFYLLDDAFRKGEYIDLGTVKGTVERISVRSMQLRHHLGALHTVPFGEITQLTNYSRDWAMMKLELRVTYDTDVERARKLIKKLGVSLLDDPEIGDKFLQPLKSQGVFRMEDSAMIMRVKFMTKPGQQFIVRKKVYAEIRDLFDREGIKFAHKEVLVRVAHEGAGGDKAQNADAVTGAVLPVIEETGSTLEEQGQKKALGDGR